jgi:hypothetical protein
VTDIPFERRAAARGVRADVEAIFGTSPTTAPQMASKARPLGRPMKRPSRAAGIGGGVALCLAGIAVGAFLTRERPAAPVPVQVASATPAPTSLQVTLTPQPAVTPPVIEPTQTQPTLPPPKPAAKAKAKRVDCAKPGGRRCTYSVVLSADASLRAAYRKAGRAGVSRGELADYRARWSRLRRAGSHDPDRVVRGYRAMATDLNRLARERRG